MTPTIQSVDVAPTSAAHVVDLLRLRAQQQPHQAAYHAVADAGAITSLSYAALDRAARSVAVGLRELAEPGARVLICGPTDLNYIVAFFGCLYAGMVAIPAMPLERSRLKRTLPRFRAIAANAQVAAVLVPRADVAAAEEWQAILPEFAGLRWAAIEALAEHDSDRWQPPPITSATLAFLMYTSGSTGTPKGAMVTHGNIMHNLASFPGFAARPCQTVVSWLPLYHDLGLFLGLLHPLYQGALAVIFAAETFVRRPLLWLELISRYQATTSGAPNFAYDLCVRKISAEQRAQLDLRSWTLALNGAEPVRLAVIERFSAAFEDCGFQRAAFYPSYGMSDATATVTGPADFAAPETFYAERAALKQGQVRPCAADGDGWMLVGCGASIPGQQLLVVDPRTLTACPDNVVGEVWLRGPSVTQGYWGLPDATCEQFDAHLDSGEGPFFRTGDLGFVRAGSLFVVGRYRDLVIIRGQNHYPEEIEQHVELCHPALIPGGGAAFAVEADGAERLVLVHEVSALDAADWPAVVAAIQACLATQHGLQAHSIYGIAKGALPKTSSGKIARHAARELIEAEDGAVLYRWQRQRPHDPPTSTTALEQAASRSSQLLRAWLIEQLSALLDVPPALIDPRLPFSHYGLDSLLALELLGKLEQVLERQLAPALLWEYPTIEALTRYLSEGARRWSRLGEILVAAEVIALEQLQQALQQQQAQGALRLGEVLIRMQLATPEQIDMALQLQRTQGDSAPSAVQHRQQAPIAIIGMSCRFPGAENTAAFWEGLSAGFDGVDEVPQERWDLATFYDPDRSAPGKMYGRWGGFLPNLELFDTDYFGISPREAPHIDPQQRLLLETACEALEDAGIRQERLAGSRTGVFIASLVSDYCRLVFSYLPALDAYSGPGSAPSILANRLSYFLNLRGPSVSINTACSGSLVAIHQACQSLRSGESTMAIAGGVSVNLLPDGNIFFSKAGALSPDGRCKAFAADANGIVRSEGVGIVVLKPLAQAIADGDHIHAVIVGSAVNSDGRTNGIMAPNQESQEAVLRAAYDAAGLEPRQVQYIEAHGTGTSLGDVIEAEALGRVVGVGRPADQPCLLGSVKSNIGHTESAAGVAGVIKVALALQKRQLPPSIHCATPNPLIPFDKLALAVQQRHGPWPETNGAPALAGVSGFGFGGTNAHVVLQEYQPPVRQPSAAPAAGPYLLPISGHTPAALRARAADYLRVLQGAAPPRLDSLAATLAARRTHHAYRMALVGDTHAELADQLAAQLADTPASASRTAAFEQRKLVWVFSGQGSHWARMGQELLAQEPVFAAVLRECDSLLRTHVAWSLLDELAREADSSRIDEPELTQPAIFAVQVALAALLRSWGIEPDVVVGHSLGEISAAYVAGALSLAEAVQIVHQRSRLMQQLVGQGKTALAELTVSEAQMLLVGRDDLLAIAGSNSPTSVVLAGDTAELERLVGALERKGVFARMLQGVELAFHSPQMDALQPELIAALDGRLQPQPTTVPLISTVTGAAIDGQQLDAAYWARNMREPFLFGAVIQDLLAQGHALFLEVSPHAVLSNAILDGARYAERQVCVVPSLRRNRPERAALLTALGTLYTAGLTLDWDQLYPQPTPYVALPLYPWQRARYWYDQLIPDGVPLSAMGLQTGLHTHATTADQSDQHPLLGYHIQSANGTGQFWQTALSVQSLPILADHQVQQRTILPGAAYVEMSLTAAATLFAHAPVQLCDLAFKQALEVPAAAPCTLQLASAPTDAHSAEIQIASRSGPAAAWTIHATGRVARVAAQPLPTHAPLAAVRQRCPTAVAPAAHYATMAEHGLVYGPAFQALSALWQGEEEAVARLELPGAAAHTAQRFTLHPVLLDAAFQTLAAALPADLRARADEMLLPVGVRRLQVYADPGTGVWCHTQFVRTPSSAAGLYEATLTLLTDSGVLAAVIEGLQLRRLPLSSASQQPPQLEDWLYTQAWHTAPPESASSDLQQRSFLIFADHAGLGATLHTRLLAAGSRCTLVCADAPGSVAADGRVSLDLRDAAALRQLIERHADGAPTPTEIIYLHAITAADTPPDVEHFEPSTAALALLQALIASQRATARVWLVTCGAQAVTADAPLALNQAPLLGIGKALALEHPELRPTLVDLDPLAAISAQTDQLLQALCDPGNELQIAYRSGQRYVLRLERQPPFSAAEPQQRIRADASYLITGGLGGVGLAVARWLAQHGAGQLILLGRSVIPPRADWPQLDPHSRLGRITQAVREIEALGTTVLLPSLDIADQAALDAFLVQQRAAANLPIRGVIHAAGVLRDQLIATMTHEALIAALQPKIAGAWHLHTALRDTPLDFFVMFSSLAAVFGSVGQANYAAGNAFLDALVQQRRRQGLPGQSLNWGPWGETGMALESGAADHMQAQGMLPLTTAQALAAFGRLLTSELVQTTIAAVDWPTWLTLNPAAAATPFFAALQQALPAPAPREGQDTFVHSVLHAPPAQRQPLIAERVAAVVGKVLRMSPQGLEHQRPLLDFGIDSIMGIELKNGLEQVFSVSLPISYLLQGPSVEQIAATLLAHIALAYPDELAESFTAATTADSALELLQHAAEQHDEQELARLLAELEALSPDEAQARLGAEH